MSTNDYGVQTKIRNFFIYNSIAGKYLETIVTTEILEHNISIIYSKLPLEPKITLGTMSLLNDVSNNVLFIFHFNTHT